MNTFFYSNIYRTMYISEEKKVLFFPISKCKRLFLFSYFKLEFEECLNTFLELEKEMSADTMSQQSKTFTVYWKKLQITIRIKETTNIRCIKYFKWPTFWKPLKLCALTLGFFSLIFWLYRALCKVAFSRIENVLGNKCNTISAYTMKNSKYTSFILKRKKDQTKPTEE